MADAVWDDRFRRTGFYEIIDRHDGFKYQRQIPVYLLNLIGFGGGPILEPADCMMRTQMGDGSAAASSEYAWKKVDQYVELGSRLNEIIEDTKTGEEKPTPLHSYGFGWPL